MGPEGDGLRRRGVGRTSRVGRSRAEWELSDLRRKEVGWRSRAGRGKADGDNTVGNGELSGLRWRVVGWRRKDRRR